MEPIIGSGRISSYFGSGGSKEAKVLYAKASHHRRLSHFALVVKQSVQYASFEIFLLNSKAFIYVSFIAISTAIPL